MSRRRRRRPLPAGGASRRGQWLRDRVAGARPSRRVAGAAGARRAPRSRSASRARRRAVRARPARGRGARRHPSPAAPLAAVALGAWALPRAHRRRTPLIAGARRRWALDSRLLAPAVTSRLAALGGLVLIADGAAGADWRAHRRAPWQQITGGRAATPAPFPWRAVAGRAARRLGRAAQPWRSPAATRRAATVLELLCCSSCAGAMALAVGTPLLVELAGARATASAPATRCEDERRASPRTCTTRCCRRSRSCSARPTTPPRWRGSRAARSTRCARGWRARPSSARRRWRPRCATPWPRSRTSTAPPSSCRSSATARSTAPARRSPPRRARRCATPRATRPARRSSCSPSSSRGRRRGLRPRRGARASTPTPCRPSAAGMRDAIVGRMAAAGGARDDRLGAGRGHRGRAADRARR